jgi:carboxyl-terminal processing protease
MTLPESLPFFPAKWRLVAGALALVSMLSACGGGGGDSGAGIPVAAAPQLPVTPGAPGSSGSVTPDPIPTESLAELQNICAAPRTGTDANGYAYSDRQGTVLDEMKFLRAWTDMNYLWYDEIPATVHMADYTNPLDYFDVLKTPALTAAGTPKDRFHFTYPTTVWDALNGRGEEVGYGVTWSRNAAPNVPRTWLAAIVEPGSPAAAAGLVRGDMLVAVDGIDFVSTADKAGVDNINAGLFPDNANENHKLTIRRAGSTFDVTLTSRVVVSDPVRNVKLLDTASGKVGYLTFNDHNAVSEKQLVDAFTTFKGAGVTDLVLDMRYNGGGLLTVAAELAYMIAGPGVAGKTFEDLRYNGKTAPQPVIPFRATAYGFPAPLPVRQGQGLPSLGLKRVTVLTSSSTCSASEAVINGLRGVDVEVNLIGGQTCGKPYGFTPIDNCGTTYFSIQFRGVNAKGYGDFNDGFAPTCAVPDDLAHSLGDPAENQLAAALAYRATGACPAPAARAGVGVLQSVRPAGATQLVRPAAKEIAILQRAGGPENMK